MGWAIILAIAYIPLFYRMQRRLHQLEQEVRELKQRWKET
jgi:Tfp pilus assembly protein PilO